MTAADIYLRLSDLRTCDLDGDGHSSLVRKERQLRERAALLGWTVHRVVIENDAMPPARNGEGKPRFASAFKRRKLMNSDGTPRLDDAGHPVYRVWRPGFRSILDDLTAGRAHAILAEDLDRACRDPRDLEDLIDIMEATRANARSLSGSLQFTDGGTDAEITMARILVTMGNKSSRDTARRVAQARGRRAEAGENGGGRRPFGFAVDNGQLIIIEAEAKVIRAAAAAVLAEGDDAASLKSVARSLREQGVASVTGAAWTAETLKSILVRPSLAGISVHRGKPVDVPEAKKPGWMREPILEPQQWADVVTHLTNPARRTNNGNAPRWIGSGIYLCGVCDDGTTTHVGGGTKKSPAYLCKASSHLRRTAVPVDELVEAHLIAALERPEAVSLLTPALPGVDRAALRKALITHEARLTQIARDHDDDLITREQMLTQTANRRKKIATITAQLAASSPAPDPLDGIAGRPDAAAIWAGMTLEQHRAILRRVAVVTLMPVSRRGRGLDRDSVNIAPVTA